ncbi:hypothetical protein BC567DRAFT_215814 [Phyllosticta citribraziliensis]
MLSFRRLASAPVHAPARPRARSSSSFSSVSIYLYPYSQQTMYLGRRMWLALLIGRARPTEISTALPALTVLRRAFRHVAQLRSARLLCVSHRPPRRQASFSPRGDGLRALHRIASHRVVALFYAAVPAGSWARAHVVSRVDMPSDDVGARHSGRAAAATCASQEEPSATGTGAAG